MLRKSPWTGLVLLVACIAIACSGGDDSADGGAADNTPATVAANAPQPPTGATQAPIPTISDSAAATVAAGVTVVSGGAAAGGDACAVITQQDAATALGEAV